MDFVIDPLAEANLADVINVAQHPVDVVAAVTLLWLGSCMEIRYPAPVEPGARIGVTSPSAGVQESMRPRFDFAVDSLRRGGYDVVIGECMDGSGVVSTSAQDRASELTAMLTDPTIAAVVPPWGGELAIDILPLLDFDRIAKADPTWLVGFSDMSTLLFPITIRTGIATLHGNNLMDSPYEVPSPLLSWRDTASLKLGQTVIQGQAEFVRLDGFDDYVANPTVEQYTFDTPSSWKLLDASLEYLTVEGRLIGGCLETLAMLPGTPYGDLNSFAGSAAPDGLLVYLEAAESNALVVARYLLHLRSAGWFDNANAIMIGRTRGEDSGSFTQLDALRLAFDGLDVPVVHDVDCGHVPPHLSIVNGSNGKLVVNSTTATLEQSFS